MVFKQMVIFQNIHYYCSQLLLFICNDIDKSINIALENNADSVVSVEETAHPYYLRSLDKTEG